MTSFVGRDADVAEARQLLAPSRLLTLTGPGDTGKSRLALQLAARVAGDSHETAHALEWATGLPAMPG